MEETEWNAECGDSSDIAIAMMRKGLEFVGWPQGTSEVDFGGIMNDADASRLCCFSD